MADITQTAGRPEVAKGQVICLPNAPRSGDAPTSFTAYIGRTSKVKPLWMTQDELDGLYAAIEPLVKTRPAKVTQIRKPAARKSGAAKVAAAS
jgi:hypothetical protein